MRNVEFMRMFALGLFVALSGVASLLVDGRAVWAVVAVAGAAIAWLAWPKVRPFAWDADQSGVRGELDGTAA